MLFTKHTLPSLFGSYFSHALRRILPPGVIPKRKSSIGLYFGPPKDSWLEPREEPEADLARPFSPRFLARPIAEFSGRFSV